MADENAVCVTAVLNFNPCKNTRLDAECQSFFHDISYFLFCNVITCECCILKCQHLRTGLDHVAEPYQLDKNCGNGRREEVKYAISSNLFENTVLITTFSYF